MGPVAALTRRDLLAAIGAAWLVDVELPARRPIEGALLGASHRVGHKLRDGAQAATATRVERADVVIVGSGASGASAAWRLAAAGVETRLLELEPFAGGTSAWGEDGVVAHPWGAHYLPAPNPSALGTLRLLEEMGELTGWDAGGNPRFKEESLCHAPDERLFHGGQWHPSLIPASALEPNDLRELARFRDVRNRYRTLVGRDGRPAFTIPLSLSSRDPELLDLDRMTMAAWLDREGFHSQFVRWYVEYATLDDFGANLTDVSAWAGLHYFCARKLETDQLHGSHYLVWPEGNGRLVKHLLGRMHGHREHHQLVTRVESIRDGVRVSALDLRGSAPVPRTIEARAVILAIPGFIARRLVAPAVAARLTPRASSPWVVANLHVTRPFDPNHAWDSVLYDSPSLGYTDAGHQRTRPSEQTVLTHFRAYGSPNVEATRADLIGRGWASLASDVLLDLAPAHPELADSTSRIDVMVWGHAMPRPRPGFLNAAGREPLETDPVLDERIAWAHVDQSGYALFEEANTHGIRAAEHIAHVLGVNAGTSWL